MRFTYSADRQCHSSINFRPCQY